MKVTETTTTKSDCLFFDRWLLEKDISVPAERAQSLAAAATAHLNAALHELRR